MEVQIILSNLIQKHQYISDIVGEQYKTWEDEFIVFDAATSSGKTYFALHMLAPYAETVNKKILYLCNRRKLREDIESEIKALGYSHVEVLSYQTLQTIILEDTEIKKYDYIIFDEIHYLTADAFNEYTDIASQFLMAQSGNVRILMSATAKSFFQNLLQKGYVKQDHYYSIDKNYSYVKKVYFYNADTLPTLIDGILEKSPDDKIVVFCNAGQRMIDMYEIYKDNADYYCSKDTTNKKLKRICNPKCIIRYSENHISFDKQILFTTKALDNGIDLKDECIRHIFSEIFDLDSLVQSLGRKRCLNYTEDTCDFYIKHYKPQALRCFKNEVARQLGPVRLYKKNTKEFLKLYGGGKGRQELRKNKIFYMNFLKDDDIDNEMIISGDVRINNMMYEKYNTQNQEILDMLKKGYLHVVSYWLGEELSKKIEILDIDPIKRDLFLEYLESVTDKPLFKDERTELKEEFTKIGLRDRTMGINTLNGKLKDRKYPYKIIKEKDYRRILEDGTENQNRNKWYWLITKT